MICSISAYPYGDGGGDAHDDGRDARVRGAHGGRDVHDGRGVRAYARPHVHRLGLHSTCVPVMPHFTLDVLLTAHSQYQVHLTYSKNPLHLGAAPTMQTSNISPAAPILHSIYKVFID